MMDARDLVEGKKYKLGGGFVCILTKKETVPDHRNPAGLLTWFEFKEVGTGVTYSRPWNHASYTRYNAFADVEEVL